MTTVVNMKYQEYDVCIARGTSFGNPFIISRDGSRKVIIEKFRRYLHERVEYDDGYKTKLLDLRDKVLGCYCKPLACHGDVIIDYLDSLEPA